MCNSGASFQKMVDTIFSGLKGVDLMVFIDDTCIASRSWNEHLSALKKVLTCVREAGLVIQPTKCNIGPDTITFLGHVISPKEIHPDPEKVSALKRIATPTNVTEIKRILGLDSYYRRLIPNLASMSEPLINLTRKNVPFVWNDERKSSFESIKNSLSSDLCVACYDHKKETRLKTDACLIGIGGILQQKNDRGEWMIIACYLRRLNSAEKNYSITDLEGLALVWCIQKFRAYLLGKEFTVLVDHCPLCILSLKKPSSARLARWSVLLSEYNMKIEYIKGGLHEDVDCISRAPITDADDTIENTIIQMMEVLNFETILTKMSFYLFHLNHYYN